MSLSGLDLVFAVCAATVISVILTGIIGWWLYKRELRNRD